MEFNDVIKQFSERILSLKDTITTEESTKMSLVVPLFQLLGYDVFNPNEFCPEYIAEDIVHRDTESYFGILYKDNNRKPICRLNLDARNKQLLIPDANKKFERIYIDSLNDLYKYKNRLIEVVKRYM